MAEGSQGWRPNCADLPVAARIKPISGMLVCSVGFIKICWSSHELELNINHAIDRTKPMSPIRLYKIACNAAVFASARPYHQPMSRKDIIPTPSQPINN